ncbi:tRNA lysidine(34) synthetase TilS [Cryptosporangium aurantiacum]|uniref:tRNA(Ile)-lysidine synthase n=1 Tax=Cryptosporangium aurantiacum TaxID=134849 RepID=A0A1M7NCQ3_9ACTN|nr:tRNA lysidine(34) synthetase TilS [Cryptosporangium aurantiacum]SHN01423.1 tRNA(Ile)-lysidine synthase [Cryptosporangium aurantiacum]
MVGPPAAVAAVRVAVRAVLRELPAGSLVLVACSGGPDSAALAAATAFEASRAGLRAGLVTIDHGLQPGSASRAADVAAWGTKLGFEPSEAVPVEVGTGGGPEAAARYARYAALDAAAVRHGAAAVLLGHTADDQAETVLLGLARGSGARSAAGMAPVRGVYRRPLLELSRATTHAACADEALPTWHDPHNVDPAYARSRVRAVLPALEEAAGGGLMAGLARSAALLRADADLLDELAAELLARAMVPAEDPRAPGQADAVRADAAAPAAERGLDVRVLADAHPALRGRVLRRWAIEQGAPAGTLASTHVDALDALVIRWRGQGAVHLPLGIEVVRTNGILVARRFVPR